MLVLASRSIKIVSDSLSRRGSSRFQEEGAILSRFHVSIFLYQSHFGENSHLDVEVCFRLPHIHVEVHISLFRDTEVLFLPHFHVQF